MSPEILNASYVDRGKLDMELEDLLQRPVHIALKGDSKCGKSWLRKRIIKNALVVQCTYHMQVHEIYEDALNQLEIDVVKERSTGFGIGTFFSGQASETSSPIFRGVGDLRFVAKAIADSGRRFVIEDFHYLSLKEREILSSHLKALWDMGLTVIIIGVWAENNLLTTLNPDLTGRIVEKNIFWDESDLLAVIKKGSYALNISILDVIVENLIRDCFGSVGLLQILLYEYLYAAGVLRSQDAQVNVFDLDLYSCSAKNYACQLQPKYIQFISRLSQGIRKNRTKTYARVMKVIIEAEDEELLTGLSTSEIFTRCRVQAPTIQLGNLKTVLKKLEEMQETDKRGLVIAYDQSSERVSIVDRELLFFRRYTADIWPFDALLDEMSDEDGAGKIERVASALSGS